MTRSDPVAALINAKLQRPLVTTHLIPRPRLHRILDGALSVPLTLVCAPAGFGKTTLISAWVREITDAGAAASPPVAWLSLDERDSELSFFLRAFVAAMRTQLPAACADTMELLASPVKPSFDLILAALSNDLLCLPRPFVLVLDDYHTISSPGVHDLLSELCRHWPPFMHLVLISRTNPSLPLARLRANGQIVEIRSRDLRFTSAESAAFLDEILPSPPSQALVALLDRRTEGWVVGLQLAALSLVGPDRSPSTGALSSAGASPDLELLAANLVGGDAVIADYLVGEVLSHQPAAIQEFLLQTSILDRFSVGLCESVIEKHAAGYDVRAYVDWLERANLFVVPLDNQRQWYRYHRLFQELLQRRLLAEAGPERVLDLHHRASAWFAARKLIDEAIHHALAARDPNLAAQLMEAAMCDVLNRDDRAALEQWLHLLPEEIIVRRPGMLMIKAWVQQLSWQIPAQTKLLEQVEALISDEPGASLAAGEMRFLRGQLLTLYAQAAYFHNESSRAVALCQEAMALLPPECLYVRGGNMIYLGLAMQASGQGGAAEHLLLDAYESLSEKTTSFGLRLLVALSFVYLQEGQLEQVRQTAQLLLSQAPPAMFIIPRSWAHFFLGMVYYYRNDLEQAQQHFETVVQARFVTQMLTARACFFGLILTQQARGQDGEARQSLELLSQFDMETRGAEDVRTRSLRARIMLLQDDLEGAWLWVETVSAAPLDQPLLWLEEPALTRIRVLLARGDEQSGREALQLLDALDETARRTHHARFKIELLALRALALASLGESGDAVATLQQAVQIARGGGFLRVFVELGPPMQRLLERLIRYGLSAETARRILAAFPRPQKTGDAGHLPEPHPAADVRDAAPMVERLTMREIDVLFLLRERLSNKEIAHNLSLSTTTVKRHTANIYGKLGVNRRWDAVIRAEALGFLPPR